MVALITLQQIQHRESQELKQNGRLEAIIGRILAEQTFMISLSIIR